MVSGFLGMCVIESIHGGKKKLFHFLWIILQKCSLKLMVFKVSSPVNLLFMTILIELMLPQDRQMLLDVSRNQYYGIWTIFS